MHAAPKDGLGFHSWSGPWWRSTPSVEVFPRRLHVIGIPRFGLPLEMQDPPVRWRRRGSKSIIGIRSPRLASIPSSLMTPGRSDRVRVLPLVTVSNPRMVPVVLQAFASAAGQQFVRARAPVAEPPISAYSPLIVLPTHQIHFEFHLRFARSIRGDTIVRAGIAELRRRDVQATIIRGNLKSRISFDSRSPTEDLTLK